MVIFRPRMRTAPGKDYLNCQALGLLTSPDNMESLLRANCGPTATADRLYSRLNRVGVLMRPCAGVTEWPSNLDAPLLTNANT
jgi:hypothetical protein